MVRLALVVAAVLFLGWVLVHFSRRLGSHFRPIMRQPVTRERWDFEVRTFGRVWARLLYRVVPDNSPELQRPRPWWIVAD